MGNPHPAPHLRVHCTVSGPVRGHEPQALASSTARGRQGARETEQDGAPETEQDYTEPGGTDSQVASCHTEESTAGLAPGKCGDPQTPGEAWASSSGQPVMST